MKFKLIRLYFLLLSVILISIVALSSYFFIFNKAEHVLPAKESGLQYKIGMKEEETIYFEKNGEEWQTYKNYVYGYEVSAPKDWKINGGGYSQSDMQYPSVSIDAPVEYDVPQASTKGANYVISFTLDSQVNPSRHASISFEGFPTPHYAGEQAVHFYELGDEVLKSTKGYQVSREIIPTVKYLYTVENAKSFAKSYFNVLSLTPTMIISPSLIPTPTLNPILSKTSGTNILSLDNGSVTFTLPDSWTFESGENICHKFMGDAINPNCLDVAVIAPGIKLPTRYGNGTEFFHFNIEVDKIIDNFDIKSTFGLGTGIVKKSSISINGYNTFFMSEQYEGDGTVVREIHYAFSIHGKIVILTARTFEPGREDDGTPVGDFRQFEPLITSVANSVKIK